MQPFWVRRIQEPPCDVPRVIDRLDGAATPVPQAVLHPSRPHRSPHAQQRRGRRHLASGTRTRGPRRSCLRASCTPGIARHRWGRGHGRTARMVAAAWPGRAAWCLLPLQGQGGWARVATAAPTAPAARRLTVVGMSNLPSARREGWVVARLQSRPVGPCWSDGRWASTWSGASLPGRLLQTRWRSLSASRHEGV